MDHRIPESSVLHIHLNHETFYKRMEKVADQCTASEHITSTQIRLRIVFGLALTDTDSPEGYGQDGVESF